MPPLYAGSTPAALLFGHLADPNTAFEALYNTWQAPEKAGKFGVMRRVRLLPAHRVSPVASLVFFTGAAAGFS